MDDEAGIWPLLMIQTLVIETIIMINCIFLLHSSMDEGGADLSAMVLAEAILNAGATYKVCCYDTKEKEEDGEDKE